MNRYPVGFDKTLSLRYALFDEYDVQIFHILQTDKFVDRSIIPDVAFRFRIRFPPLSGRHTEHSHVQYVRFISINDISLLRRNLCGIRSCLVRRFFR